MKIYTKTGDQGMTSLALGERVGKDDIRIEVNGEIDELDSILGVAASFMEDEACVSEIHHVQKLLMLLMSAVAMAPISKNMEMLSEEIERMEKQIDEAVEDGLFNFVLPGGSKAQSFLHLARSKARTCERRLYTMNREYPLDDDVLRYMNRLSDWLFALAIK